MTINEHAVFSSLPSREEVLSELKIGALDPEIFSNSQVTYSLFESSPDVEAYVASDSGAIGATSTIFKVVDEWRDPIYLKNMASSITVGGLYELRNPPSFMNLVRVALRDAEYEIDAFLMHLIRHKNTAPFVSKKLIQYSGVSNPSPDFVYRVSQAFIRGNFTSNGVTFGDHKYGNLKAVAAAIALDEEANIPVIDEDPISGNVREPLLKVISFMRSLSFQRRPNVKFRHGLFDEMTHKVSADLMRYDDASQVYLTLKCNIVLCVKIGQMVFDPPDQFSFFSSGKKSLFIN